MDNRKDSDIYQVFTKREKEIVGLIVEGLTNKEIAQKLWLTEATVKSYITNILTKTNFKDRREIIIYFIRQEKLATKEGKNQNII